MKKFSVSEWMVQLTGEKSPPKRTAFLNLQSLDNRDLPSLMHGVDVCEPAKIVICAPPKPGPVCPPAIPKCPPVQSCPPTPTTCPPAQNGSHGKGSHAKASHGKGSAGKCDTKGSHAKASSGKGSHAKASACKGSSAKASHGKGSAGKCSGGKASGGKCDLFANHPCETGGDEHHVPCGYGYVPCDTKGSGSKASGGKCDSKGSGAKASHGKCDTKGSSGKGSHAKASHGKGSRGKAEPCGINAPNPKDHACKVVEALCGVGTSKKRK